MERFAAQHPNADLNVIDCASATWTECFRRWCMDRS